ncbi:MAG: hypothetical protein WCY88_15890 [Spongiibacteraceae bacterium]
MTNNEILYASFEQAAEKHGDITDAVCTDLFKRYPKAAHCFTLRGEQFEQELKQQMVRDSIYAFFEYLDTPEEVEISFKYTIPQHQSLDIPLEYIVALMQSVANIACESVSEAERVQTKTCWDNIMQTFSAMIYSYEPDRSANK